MFLAITSSTVCALAVIEKNAMAASKGRKKRIIRQNSTNGVDRNSAFMNSPPTHCYVTISLTEGTETANLLLLRRNQQHLVSRLSLNCQEVSLHRHLELPMQPQRRHHDRSAVPVVARVNNVLHPRSDIDPAPNMRRVVRLHDVLPPVVQLAIAKQEAFPAVGQIRLMIFLDSVRYEGQPGTVLLAMPFRAIHPHALGEGRFNFGVSEFLIFPVVPSPARKHCEIAREILF